MYFLMRLIYSLLKRKILLWERIIWTRGMGREIATIKQVLFFRIVIELYIFPFHATGLISYLLKTSENQKFFWCFQGVWKETVAWNGLSHVIRGIMLVLWCCAEWVWGRRSAIFIVIFEHIPHLFLVFLLSNFTFSWDSIQLINIESSFFSVSV